MKAAKRRSGNWWILPDGTAVPTEEKQLRDMARQLRALAIVTEEGDEKRREYEVRAGIYERKAAQVAAARVATDVRAAERAARGARGVAAHGKPADWEAQIDAAIAAYPDLSAAGIVKLLPFTCSPRTVQRRRKR